VVRGDPSGGRRGPENPNTPGRRPNQPAAGSLAAGTPLPPLRLDRPWVAPEKAPPDPIDQTSTGPAGAAQSKARRQDPQLPSKKSKWNEH